MLVMMTSRSSSMMSVKDALVRVSDNYQERSAKKQVQDLVKDYLENRCVVRAWALTASSVRFLRDAFVSSELRRLLSTAAIASTAAKKAASLALDGEFMPLTLRTNCNAAARISSSVAGGSKLKRILMFLHISVSYPSLLQHSHKSILFRLIVGGKPSRTGPCSLRAFRLGKCSG